MPLPGRKAEETRARIVAAAAKLFGAHGFDRTSTRAIAAEAGVAHGTLFRYAPTKEDLVEAVFADRIGAALDGADDSAPVGGAFTDLAMHYYEAFVAAYAEDAAIARVVVKELPFFRGEAQARQQLLTFRLFAALSGHIEAGIARGDVRDDTSGIVVASMSFSLYYAAVVGWLSCQLDREGAMALLRTQHLLLEQSWARVDEARATAPASSPLERGGSNEP